MIENMLLEAVQLAREGRTVEARWLIQEVLRQDRANETAWLLMADCAETREESILALESCLRHVPNAPRARVGLDILRSEGHAYRRGGLLTDRLNLAVKNIKSQPRKQVGGELSKRIVDLDGLEKLREELPAGWVPIAEADRLREQPAADAAGEPDATVFSSEDASPDDALPAVQIERPKAWWDVETRPVEPLPPAAPAEAFLVSPEEFTPDEIHKMEVSLGPVPVARRRVSLANRSSESWKTLSEAELPEARRVIRRPLRRSDLPVGKVLLYALLVGGMVLLAAVLILIAAFVLVGV